MPFRVKQIQKSSQRVLRAYSHNISCTVNKVRKFQILEHTSFESTGFFVSTFLNYSPKTLLSSASFSLFEIPMCPINIVLLCTLFLCVQYCIMQARSATQGCRNGTGGWGHTPPPHSVTKWS